MGQSLFEVGLGLSIDNQVELLISVGAPGGDAGLQDAAPAGSLAFSPSTGKYYVKSTAGSGADKWGEQVDKDYVDTLVTTGISWREPVRVLSTETFADLAAAATELNDIATPGSIGGVDSDQLVDGDRIVLTDLTTGTENVYIVTGTPGSAATLVEDGNTLTEGDAVYVEDGTAADTLQTYNGTAWVQIGGSQSAELGDIRTFVGKSAAGAETPTYSSNNEVVDGTSLETAIGTLDAAVGTNATGVSDNATAISTLQGEVNDTQTGAGLETDGSYSANGSTNYLGSATSLKTADEALDTQVKANADAIGTLQTDVAGINQQFTKTGVTTEDTLDQVLVDAALVAKWIVHVKQGSTVNVVEVLATHDGGAGDATDTDYTTYARLRMGNIPGLSFDVDVSGAGAAQYMRLRAASTSAADFEVVRQVVMAA